MWLQWCIIIVKGTINVTDPNNDAYGKKLSFKNNAPFISYISKINNTFIENAEDLDLLMPIYNLIEYRKYYSKTTRSLLNYYRDKPNIGAVGNINYSIKDSKSFDYKTSITEKLENNDVENVEIAVPSKYLGNFWRALDMALINCEVNLCLTRSWNCVIISKAVRDADPDADPAVATVNNLTGATFKIKDTKFYVPVVTFLTTDDNTL